MPVVPPCPPAQGSVAALVARIRRHPGRGRRPAALQRSGLAAWPRDRFAYPGYVSPPRAGTWLGAGTRRLLPPRCPGSGLREAGASSTCRQQASHPALDRCREPSGKKPGASQSRSPDKAEGCLRDRSPEQAPGCAALARATAAMPGAPRRVAADRKCGRRSRPGGRGPGDMEVGRPRAGAPDRRPRRLGTNSGIAIPSAPGDEDRTSPSTARPTLKTASELAHREAATFVRQGPPDDHRDH